MLLATNASDTDTYKRHSSSHSSDSLPAAPTPSIFLSRNKLPLLSQGIPGRGEDTAGGKEWKLGLKA